MVIPLRLEAARGVDHVVLRLDQHWHFLTSGGLEDAMQQLERRFQHIGRAHVDLCHHHKHGFVQGQCQTQMLCGNDTDTMLSASKYRFLQRYIALCWGGCAALGWHTVRL